MAAAASSESKSKQDLLHVPDHAPSTSRTAEPDKAAEAAAEKTASHHIAPEKTPPQASDVSESRIKTAASWFTAKPLYLENTSSVARDHLANERSYLAWLRTSITLASIGVVIAQLFRLSSSHMTLPIDPRLTTSNLTSIPDPIPSSDLGTIVAQLQATIDLQSEILETLLVNQRDEKRRYARLGKPIGATFLMISVLFILLGCYRYLSVQHFLVAKNYFPPARRSVLVTSIVIMALVCISFGLIIALK